MTNHNDVDQTASEAQAQQLVEKLSAVGNRVDQGQRIHRVPGGRIYRQQCPRT